MKVLFVLQYYKIGGVETVTHVLANEFQKNGIECYLFSFSKNFHENILPILDSHIPLITMDNEECDIISYLRSIIVKHNIDIIINQSGQSKPIISKIKNSVKGLNVKIISVYHNMPGLLKTVYNNKLNKSFSDTFWFILRFYRYGFHMRTVYKESDAFVLLSDSFISHFKEFTHLRDVKRLFTIPNPVTIAESEQENAKLLEKKKEIIFVGRLSHEHKRVDRILTIWRSIYTKYVDWTLTIVGDGPDRENLVKMKEHYGLERVNFVGFDNPTKYYKRASILLMTSNYEGFPLVLAEAMSFGVVPVVYRSFPSVSDIVINGFNGCISEPMKSGFDRKDFISKLEMLLVDSSLRNVYGENAKKSVCKLSIGKIYSMWKSLFVELLPSLPEDERNFKK